MKKIINRNLGIEKIMPLQHQRPNIRATKRHPVVFHSRIRYAEAEEEE